MSASKRGQNCDIVNKGRTSAIVTEEGQPQPVPQQQQAEQQQQQQQQHRKRCKATAATKPTLFSSRFVTSCISSSEDRRTAAMRLDEDGDKKMLIGFQGSSGRSKSGGPCGHKASAAAAVEDVQAAAGGFGKKKKTAATAAKKIEDNNLQLSAELCSGTTTAAGSNCNKIGRTAASSKKGSGKDVTEQSSSISDDSSQSSNSTTSKLSKIGRRLRDSCRNLRGKHPSGSSTHDPQEYTSIQSPNESLRSKHYVPMDFSGPEGRIVDIADLPGNQPTKEGYTYFRRKCLPGNVKNLLTECQSTIHKSQPWFHRGVGRDAAQRILATHSVDGLFLVRESSVSGGYVISYFAGGKTHHAQALPEVIDDCVTYSIDESKTKFFDLLQMVEFYQLNCGILRHRLTHYVIRRDTGEKARAKAKPPPPLATSSVGAASTCSPIVQSIDISAKQMPTRTAAPQCRLEGGLRPLAEHLNIDRRLSRPDLAGQGETEGHVRPVSNNGLATFVEAQQPIAEKDSPTSERPCECDDNTGGQGSPTSPSLESPGNQEASLTDGSPQESTSFSFKCPSSEASGNPWEAGGHPYRSRVMSGFDSAGALEGAVSGSDEAVISTDLNSGQRSVNVGSKTSNCVNNGVVCLNYNNNNNSIINNNVINGLEGHDGGSRQQKSCNGGETAVVGTNRIGHHHQYLEASLGCKGDKAESAAVPEQGQDSGGRGDDDRGVVNAEDGDHCDPLTNQMILDLKGQGEPLEELDEKDDD